MQIGKTITFFTWLLIAFNITLSFGALWTFERMTPSIEAIRRKNISSLEECDVMLLALAGRDIDRKSFEKALAAVEQNITEPGELESINRIRATSAKLLNEGDESVYPEVVNSILDLAKENRNGVLTETIKARHMQNAGAWTVVFAALVFFFLAIILYVRVKRNLLEPVNDIAETVAARSRGDHFRRCRESGMSHDMQELCSNINDLLDK